MKLGQEMPHGELEGLHAVFGLQPLTISRSDEVRLSFDRFFAHMTPATMEEWITGLHSCLGLTLRDYAHEKCLQQQETRLFLERLRLAFPELKAVHQTLEEDVIHISRLLDGGGDTQDSYFKAAEITLFLRQNKNIITFSELGARFCNDSKALQNTSLGKLIESWLMTMEDSDGTWSAGKETIWDRHHVVSDRLSIQATLFGPLLYEKNNREYDWIYKLWQTGEPATLSWANIAGIDRMYTASDDKDNDVLITCENEAPFGRMIRERQPGFFLYTSGFSNDGVLSLYRLFALQTNKCRHWGDSDLAGLQIAAMFHAVHPLQLWRCDLATLQTHQNCLIPVSEEQKNRITQFLINQPQFPFAEELVFTARHGWLEQESWFEKG